MVLAILSAGRGAGAGTGAPRGRETGLDGEAMAIGEFMLGQGMGLYYSGESPHKCARMLRGALRVAAGRTAADPNLNLRLVHLALQARLFLANVLVQSGGAEARRRAEELYANGVRGARGAPANTLAGICKENLAASRRHAPGASADPPGERFLVFRFWAGLSNRRQELIGVMAAAKLLNRPLVLPDIVEARPTITTTPPRCPCAMPRRAQPRAPPRGRGAGWRATARTARGCPSGRCTTSRRCAASCPFSPRRSSAPARPRALRSPPSSSFATSPTPASSPTSAFGAPPAQPSPPAPTPSPPLPLPPPGAGRSAAPAVSGGAGGQVRAGGGGAARGGAAAAGAPGPAGRRRRQPRTGERPRARCRRRSVGVQQEGGD